MLKKVIAVPLMALGATFMLAGCGDGGGGVASTPVPTPTSTPSPTPTAGANADLLGPLKSESFANLSVRGTGQFDSSLNPTVQAAAQTATIQFDAARSTYVLSTGGGSITFTPADIDSALSSAGAVVYVKGNGSNTTDSLTVTRPGTSGPLTYKYVGSAFWQHTVVNGTAGSGAIDAIVYGIVTPSVAVPRTGSAFYGLDLIGAVTSGAGANPFSGSGIASLLFDTGKVTLTGTTNYANTGFTRTFTGSGTIASSGNALSGSITFEDLATLTGTFSGKLFGPTADEFGAVFSAAGSTGNFHQIAVGTLMGRRASAGGNASFNSSGLLDQPQAFTTTSVRLDATAPNGFSNNDRVGSFSNQALSSEPLSIIYDGTNYTVISPTRSRTYTPETLFGGDTLSVTAAHYLAVGNASQLSSTSPQQGQFGYFLFGMPTTNAQLVRSGAAGYAITFGGRAIDNDYLNEMRIGGNGAITVDFAAGALNLTGLMSFGEDYVMAGRVARTASSAISRTGSLAASANAFSGNLSFGGIGNYTGTYSGQFFGPNAEQLGATFLASDGSDKAVGFITGIADPTILAGYQTLTGLAADTTFNASIPGPFSRTLDYHPSTGAWTFHAPDTTGGAEVLHGFGPGDIVSASSNASQTYYQRSDASGDISGYLFNPGSSNPTLALSYTSFGDLLVRNTIVPAGFGYRNFLVFGIETPASLRPRSGTATYSGLARGTGSVQSMSFGGDVSGTSALTTDFAAGTANLTLNLATVEAAPRTIGTFTMNGQIATNAIFSSTFSGNLFGPNAEEFGAAWSLIDDPVGGRTALSGIAVGKKD